ncbi:MmcQ/YjbR family DNA-binding protein [Phenylobacterium sp.]|uniref:MmcQ/YjbR family DNA-binding protein n=1 Tax=Phenylobacterium sp. TaxID=1871053 RepID=UPI003562081F
MEDFDTLCSSFPGAGLTIQWGGSHVYKIGGKIFAMAGLPEPDAPLSVIFKTSEITAHILLEAGSARKSSYLPQGNWLEVSGSAMSAADLADYLRQSHDFVGQTLPRRIRSGFGVGDSSAKVGKR